MSHLYTEVEENGFRKDLKWSLGRKAQESFSPPPSACLSPPSLLSHLKNKESDRHKGNLTYKDGGGRRLKKYNNCSKVRTVSWDGNCGF